MSAIERVIFVHGTGATAASDAGQAWWQRDGRLWSEFEQCGFVVEAFIWSGLNSESVRRAAGAALRARILQIAGADERVHLVGHSHGGSVIAHALEHLPADVAASILSWSTVGTPVLRYAMRRGRLLIELVALAICCAVILYGAALLRGVHLEYAWRDFPLDTARFFAWFALPTGGVLWSGLSMLRGILAVRSARSARIEVDPDRYMSLWSRQDEPILGLGASGSFSLRVMGNSGATGHLAGRPLNQLVNNAVSRALQGSDIPVLELRGCVTSAGGLAHRSLPEAIDASLIRRADEYTAALGGHVRDILVSGADPLTGFVDLQRGAAQAFTFKELVHTSYFDEPSCRQLLLYHATQHSTRFGNTMLQPDLADWYAERYDEPPRPPSHALPANRLGYVVATATAVAAVLAFAVTTSLRATYDSVLAPTTAKYQLGQILTARQLNVALGSIVPVENLEQVLLDPHLLINSPESVGAKLEVLNAYLDSALAAGQHESVIASALQVDPALQPILQGYALPYLLSISSQQQLLAFAHSELYPGPAGRFSSSKELYYPALEQLVWYAGGRNLLDQQLLAYAISRCPAGLCAARVKLAAARSLARVKSPLLQTLAPLPAAGDYVMLADSAAWFSSLLNSAFVHEAHPQSPLEAGLDEDDRNLVIWLVRHREWQHLAKLNPGSVGDLSWSDLAPEIQSAVDAGGVSQAAALGFMSLASWSDQVPADFIVKANKIANARHLPPVMLMSRSLEINTLLECSMGTKMSLNARYVKLKQLDDRGQHCPQLVGLAPDPSAALIDLAGATSMNAYLKTFNMLALRSWPEHLRAPLQENLIATLIEATCQRAADERPFSRYESLDRQLLRTALRSLRDAASPRDIAAWYKHEDPRPCLQTEFSHYIRTISENRDAITFELIDWLAPEYGQSAVKLMRFLTATQFGPVPDIAIARIGTGVPDEDYARWFDQHGQLLDELFLTAGQKNEFRLVRSAAAYKLASCKCAVCDQVRLHQLAVEEGNLARTYAVPAIAKPALIAEAEFHALRHDWRRAGETCSHCNAVERVGVESRLIRQLAREVAGQSLALPDCAPVEAPRFKLLFQGVNSK